MGNAVTTKVSGAASTVSDFSKNASLLHLTDTEFLGISDTDEESVDSDEKGTWWNPSSWTKNHRLDLSEDYIANDSQGYDYFGPGLRTDGTVYGDASACYDGVMKMLVPRSEFTNTAGRNRALNQRVKGNPNIASGWGGTFTGHSIKAELNEDRIREIC